MCENSEVKITKEVEIVSPVVDDVEMDPSDLFKSDLIIVDDKLLKNTKLAPERNQPNTKDQKISTEKFGGSIFSRVLKRAQSFGKNKNGNSEGRNNHNYFTMRRKKELNEAPNEKKKERMTDKSGIKKDH